MRRRLQKRQIKIVRDGGDPIGLGFEPASPPFHLGAGNPGRPTGLA
jgi:hypothetical protein